MKVYNSLKLCLLLLIVFTTLNIFSQKTLNKQDQLIKECLIPKPLQDKILAAVKTQIDDYFVDSKSVKLNSFLGFKVNEKYVDLLSTSQINKSKPYFFLNTLSINNNALAERDFIFSDNGIVKSMAVTIEFKKKNLQGEEYNYIIAN